VADGWPAGVDGVGTEIGETRTSADRRYSSRNAMKLYSEIESIHNAGSSGMM